MFEHQAREAPLYAFRKNSREEVRASRSTFRGRPYVDLRVFVERPSGEWVPTQKGLTLPVEQLALLREAVHALETQRSGA